MKVDEMLRAVINHPQLKFHSGGSSYVAFHFYELKHFDKKTNRPTGPFLIHDSSYFKNQNWEVYEGE